ncbi:MAG: SdpI family protein [Clostridia bacterium]|nr:SdpI family protein [Clostridia bacterium]
MKVSLYLTDLLIPVIMVLAGYLMHKHPPKNINWVVGYRTARSMRNTDTWVFANKKIGEIWVKAGAIALIASIAVQIPFLFLSVDAFAIMSVVLLFAQLAVLLISIIPVERALKKEFSDKKE